MGVLLKEYIKHDEVKDKLGTAHKTTLQIRIEFFFIGFGQAAEHRK